MVRCHVLISRSVGQGQKLGPLSQRDGPLNGNRNVAAESIGGVIGRQRRLLPTASRSLTQRLPSLISQTALSLHAATAPAITLSHSNDHLPLPVIQH